MCTLCFFFTAFHEFNHASWNTMHMKIHILRFKMTNHTFLRNIKNNSYEKNCLKTKAKLEIDLEETILTFLNILMACKYFLKMTCVYCMAIKHPQNKISLFTIWILQFYSLFPNQLFECWNRWYFKNNQDFFCQLEIKFDQSQQQTSYLELDCPQLWITSCFSFFQFSH